MAKTEVDPMSTWLSALLQSIAGVLIAVLLSWIASNQVDIITSQAVLQRDFVAQKNEITQFMVRSQGTDSEVKDWMKQIWPRLRTHGENIEVLRNEIEDICNCPIVLKRPEDF